MFRSIPTRCQILKTLLAVASIWSPLTVCAQKRDAVDRPGKTSEWTFSKHVKPFLKKHCLRCHNAEKMESGIRLDQLDGTLADKRLRLWSGVVKQLAESVMPPEDAPQPTKVERQKAVEWIRGALVKARSRNREKNGSVRRLTVAQYRNTLAHLLGIREDLTGVLPPDGVSKDGFTNNRQTLLLSPLLVESYFEIAEKALDLCIVDEKSKPVVQNFRMELGQAINDNPCPDNLILGANSLLLRNQDFVVTEPKPNKPFDFQPFSMRTAYRFIEGYKGNATVRGWREYSSIYHSVFACMRGTTGYPRGRAYQVVPDGLLLRPAIPSPEIFGQSSTYGPRANFKISLRELPEKGNFRVRVQAARYDDGLLLEPGARAASREDLVRAVDLTVPAPPTVMIDKAGVYQVDVHVVAGKQDQLALQLGGRHFSGTLYEGRAKFLGQADAASKAGKRIPPRPRERAVPFMLIRLAAGRLPFQIRYGDGKRLRRIVFSRLQSKSEAAKEFLTFEKRSPLLGVHVGLRRDCGSTLNPVGPAQAIRHSRLREFVFEGAINNFPSPDVEKNNVNYLAGIREIGVRSEYTDGRAMPRMLIRAIEFEGPYYESWPPLAHRRIFIASRHRNKPAVYAREVIRSFAARAFRRPITKREEKTFVAVWERSFTATRDFQQAVKDALLVVLTSPQFLFLIEHSQTPKAEDLDGYELASKLSYFLWNSPPDQRLLQLAEAKKLHGSLDDEIDRLIQDPRFSRFVEQFTSQWFSLDKLDVVKVDSKKFPRLTRDAKIHLRREPIKTMEYLIEKNLPLRNMVSADFILANEVVAAYYGLGDRSESGFDYIPIKHQSPTLGGVLSQAGILAGLSNGRESNPVKRGAWFARKIIAEPPDDPPPNVPQIDEDENPQLTLRQKLEKHRNQKGCAACHTRIDPWGIPFENYDAGGLFRKSSGIDASSTLPDKTKVRDLSELKSYLVEDRIDRVAFSFMKHLAAYATGRTLNYSEIAFLEERGIELKSRGYRMRDMIRWVVKSELFLKK